MPGWELLNPEADSCKPCNMDKEQVLVCGFQESRF